MNRFVRNGALAIMVATFALGLGFVTPSAYAAAARQQQPEGPVLGRQVGVPLTAAQTAYNANDIATALAKVAEANTVEEKTPFEVYHIEKLYGLIYVKQQDFANAVIHLNNAVDTGQMPEEDKPPLMRTMMLLNYNVKDYDRAIQYGAQGVNYPNWDAQSDQVMLTAYYFKEDYAGAEQFGLSAIARRDAAGEQVTGEFLSVLYNSQLRLDRQDAARLTMEKLAVVDPTPDHWSAVIDFAYATPNIPEHVLLNLYRLRLRTGSMAAPDYGGMANLDIKLGLPTEAKSVLDKAVAAGMMSAADTAGPMAEVNRAISGEQEALADFERLAAASASGDLDIKLGESLWTLGRAAESETAIRRGIQKGGLADTADAYLTLGIVLLDQGKMEEARQAFAQAAQSATTAQAAHVWDLYASSI